LKDLSARNSAFALTAMQALGGTLFFRPVAVASADLPTQPSALGIQAVVYLGVVVTVGAYGLYNFGVGR
ncbi:EamA family transporter, partial [Pseudomonas aeruginosa]